MDNFNDIVGNAKKAAYRLDKEFGQNCKVQIFVNMRWDIDFLCLKKDENISSGYTILKTIESWGFCENKEKCSILFYKTCV